MKTREEVRKLQDDWYRDPCWDIESTEGFEEYRGELMSYRHSCEERWAEREEEEFLRFVKQMNLEDNLGLAEYIRRLHEKLVRLEERIREMEGE